MGWVQQAPCSTKVSLAAVQQRWLLQLCERIVLLLTARQRCSSCSASQAIAAIGHRAKRTARTGV
jgi:hypothetical protein